MKYIIDASSCYMDEGASAEFYTIHNTKFGFKQFRNKRHAISAYNRQKLLSKYHLAPKVIGDICKLPITTHYYEEESNWGFVTEKARIVDENIMKKRMGQIQKLVESIYAKTGLKFWDCHYYNVGYIKRQNKFKLVCIDTGSESFNRDANAWGMNTPGPKCGQCQKLQCKCSSYYDEKCI